MKLTLKKVSNFGSELKKVIDGVKETGIHIKELQKIRYDYEEIVLGNDAKTPKFDQAETIEKYEFVMLGSDALKELARKLGSFKVKEIPLSFYESGVDTTNYEAKKVICRDLNKKESVPTFGKSIDDKPKHKAKKRATSIGHFKKIAKDSNRDAKPHSKDQRKKSTNNSSRKGRPVQPIMSSGVSYLKEDFMGYTSKYSTIQLNDKRSKSIESNAFRDAGKVYRSQDHNPSPSDNPHAMSMHYTSLQAYTRPQKPTQPNY